MMDSRDISQLSDDDSSVERYIPSNRRQKIRGKLNKCLT